MRANAQRNSSVPAQRCMGSCSVVVAGVANRPVNKLTVLLRLVSLLGGKRTHTDITAYSDFDV